MGPAEFRHALGQFASGVTVVTTVDPRGGSVGLTVSAFAAVSLDPPLVLVCVGHGAEASEDLARSGVFAVSVLSERQEEWSRRFAEPGRGRHATAGLPLGFLGCALVPGAVAHIECRVTGQHRSGDHTVYVGEVLVAKVAGGRPLLHHHGRYRRLDEGEGEAEPAAEDEGEGEAR